MASVPIYDSAKVAPTGPVQTPYRPPLRAPSTEGFDQAGAQMERMGQAVSSGGSALSDIAIDKANEANQIQVINAENQGREAAISLANDPNEGYTTIKGGDVMRTGPNGEPLAVDYGQRYQQRLDQIAGTLTNDAQKRAFAASSANLSQSFQSDALRYENEQYQGYQQSVVQGSAELAGQEIALHGNDASFIDQRLPILDASVAKLGQLRGASGNEIAALQNTARSRALGQAMSSAIQSGDITTATGLYNRYGSMLLATDREQIEGPMRREMVAQTGMNYGDRVMAIVDGHATGSTPPIPAASNGQLSPQTAWSFIAKHEGGYAAHDANGAPVNFGINQSANPDVDVKNLTASGAEQIFEQRYWGPSGAGKLPPGLALMHADTYYINPGRAKQFLQESGNDPAKYMQLRQAWMQSLVQSDPAKYGKYAKAWASRNQDLAAASGSVQGGSGTDPNTGKPSMTLETAINTGVSMLYADHPDATPEMREAVEQRIEAQYRIREESAGQRVDQNLARVYNTLHDNGGDLGGLTPAQRASIPGEKWEAVQSFARQVQDSKGRTQTDPATYQALFGHPDLLKGMTDSQLFALRPKLSEGDFQTAVRERAMMQARAQNPDAKNAPGHLDFGAINTIVNSRLPTIGIDPHPKAGTDDAAHVGAIRAAINDEIASEQARVGRALNGVEIQGVVDRTFLRQSVHHGGFFSGDTYKPRFQTTDIADDEREQIDAALHRMNIPVTRENELRLFYRKQ